MTDGQLDEEVHELIVALYDDTEKGWVAHCTCGWETRPSIGRAFSLRSFEDHVALMERQRSSRFAPRVGS